MCFIKTCKWRPDIYVDTEELLTREEYQKILESDEYVAVGAKAGEKLVGAVIDKKKGNTGKPHARKRIIHFILMLFTLWRITEEEVWENSFTPVWKHWTKKEKLKRIDLKVWSFNREAYAFYKSLGLEIQCCIMEKRFKD